MIFNSATFIIFFVAVSIQYRMLTATKKTMKVAELNIMGYR